MSRTLPMLLLGTLILSSPRAHAGDEQPNRKLKGDFAVAQSSICAQTTAGFDADGRALGPVTLLTRMIESTNTYGGDGTFSSVGRTLQMNGAATAPGSFPMNESEFSCSGTYQVNGDGTFTETSTCSGTVISGATAGETFNQSAVTIHGQIRGKVLVLQNTSTVTPITLTLSRSGTFIRLCGSSGSAVKVPPRAPDADDE